MSQVETSHSGYIHTIQQEQNNIKQKKEKRETAKDYRLYLRHSVLNISNCGIMLLLAPKMTSLYIQRFASDVADSFTQLTCRHAKNVRECIFSASFMTFLYECSLIMITPS